jgi:hypothetical protein
MKGFNMLIGNSKIGDAVIDTCYVPDSEKPCETGICHPRYRNGLKWLD